MILSVVDGDRYLNAKFDGDLTTITLADIPSGIRARGHALRNRDDVYDREFGLSLALARATARLETKMAKFYVKSRS